MAQDKVDTPLCTFVQRIADYELKGPAERCLFDWLVMSAINFGYDEFTHSIRQIEEELGIKRKTQEKILSKFQAIGFLNCGYKEYKDKKYKSFKVDFVKLSSKETLSQIVRPTAATFGNFVDFFSYHAKKQGKKAVKPTKAQMKTEEQNTAIAKSLYDMLTERYNERVQMYNNGEIGMITRKKIKSALPYSKKIEMKLIGLYSLMGNKNAIMNSFTALTDYWLQGKVEIKNDILLYFLTYNDVEQCYSVFNQYLGYFNSNYGIDV